MENIVLIGFMGSGKSTIGRDVALLSGKYLLDTDNIIEQNMGKNIADIFCSVGESGFRRLEKQLILWLSVNVKNAVIATGGGMPIYNDVSCLGKVFWLDVEFNSIIKRLDSDEQARRPLLNDISKALTLYEERKPIYKQKSHYAVNANASPSKIARDIVAYFK